ncbi:hypothetical protein PGT21_031836 [Puccinia graminis f. sp. tritici]|uniref:Uncharacterized protein n=1 Tax=Puccinia graminis f. sp. tritici TaxID=56615 RepID=A0A5B0QKF8_PUCGR|nr:hypothetical protein PGT21_031836 [Puccinia graminis f. sp. tritici]KAA1130763.1 hypothetical protein PGTUg99_014279 [Puccinia graminis f. sp. tritici]
MANTQRASWTPHFKALFVGSAYNPAKPASPWNCCDSVGGAAAGPMSGRANRPEGPPRSANVRLDGSLSYLDNEAPL